MGKSREQKWPGQKGRTGAVASFGGTPPWPFENSAIGVLPEDAAKVLEIVSQAANAIRNIAPVTLSTKPGSACRGIAVRMIAASLEHVAKRWADKVVEEDGEAAAQVRAMGSRRHG